MEKIRQKKGYICGGCENGCEFLISKEGEGDEWNTVLGPDDGDCQECLETWQMEHPENHLAELDRVVAFMPDITD